MMAQLPIQYAALPAEVQGKILEYVYEVLANQLSAQGARDQIHEELLRQTESPQLTDYLQVDYKIRISADQIVGLTERAMRAHWEKRTYPQPIRPEYWQRSHEPEPRWWNRKLKWDGKVSVWVILSWVIAATIWTLIMNEIIRALS